MQSSSKGLIYLDYAATTPVDPSVIEAMSRCLGAEGNFGNPASESHVWGQRAREAVEAARVNVADLIGASPTEIIWTSGATEGNNLAIKGAIEAVQAGGHVVSSAIEHPAVLDTLGYLESKGYEVTYLAPDASGLISSSSVIEALRDDTILVSLMHVNNELGTITDIEAIGKVTSKRGILFHVDATQSVARLKVNVRKAQVDLLTFSGHKLYGPKGIGALFVRGRPSVPLVAQLHGGGHERGLRSGTLATHQIVGLGEAARLVVERFEEYAEHNRILTAQALKYIDDWTGSKVNGSRERCVDGILNVTIDKVDARALMLSLPHIGFASGSACASERIEASHALLALGLTEEQAHSSIRLSFGRFTTIENLECSLSDIGVAISNLRLLSSEGSSA